MANDNRWGRLTINDSNYFRNKIYHKKKKNVLIKS